MVVVLLALLLPAIQRVRATVDALRCKNNLRQIGQALAGYHADKQKLPPGGIEWRPPGQPWKRQLAWSAYLLPYLQEEKVSRMIDFSLPFDHPSNAVAAAVVIPAYLCPTSRREGPQVQGRGAIDYGGIFGERISSPNHPPKGCMIYDVAFRYVDIQDGHSTTLIIGEDSAWTDGQWINGRSLFDQAFAINQAPPFENDLRSDHPGGAHGLFVDGSVRFLGNRTSLAVLAAICTRAGREPISDADF